MQAVFDRERAARSIGVLRRQAAVQAGGDSLPFTTRTRTNSGVSTIAAAGSQRVRSSEGMQRARWRRDRTSLDVVVSLGAVARRAAYLHPFRPRTQREQQRQPRHHPHWPGRTSALACERARY